MVGLLGALGYAELAATVPGLSAVGAAAILGETGDPSRYDSARTWVKHAGICPGTTPRAGSAGRPHLPTGRPVLRTAAWRAIWGLLPHIPSFAAAAPMAHHQDGQPACWRQGPSGARRGAATSAVGRVQPARGLGSGAGRQHRGGGRRRIAQP
jgi:hypothetical protein